MNDSTKAILEDRFFHDGESTWEDVAERTASFWMSGRYESRRDTVADMLRNKEALCNTPALANAGRDQATGSACFVLAIEDSLDSIMSTLRDAALVHKSGGGTGFNFSKIRPAGSKVSTTTRDAPGPAEMLKLYSNAIGHVTQAGMRPGANMAIIDVDHKDAYEFVLTKINEGDIHNFNISLALNDAYMADVADGERHANRHFERFVELAHRNGEPGAFFIDTTNNTRLHPEPLECTNPCGEVPLRPYEACVLGSINLAKHVARDHGKPTLDIAHLAQTTNKMVWLLDAIIEHQYYPLPEIEREQKRYRKIGVGVMGYADLLCELGVEYGSEEAINVARRVMNVVQAASYASSEELARTLGLYDGYDGGTAHRRNLNCQVIAPTGTISRLAGCSFGIEPHFDTGHDGSYQSFIVGSVFEDFNQYHSSPVWTPASKVTLDQHLETQAAFQQYTDQAVSKTINCPEETTMLELKDAYVRAWQLGLKGTTILRENSRDNVVIKRTHDEPDAEDVDTSGMSIVCEGSQCAM